MFNFIKQLFNFAPAMLLTEKHKHILEQAEQLFALHGFDGTTIRDIAKAAKVNLAMISYYFGSKEKLIEQLFKMRLSDSLLNNEGVITNSGLNPMRRLEFIMDRYIERVFSNNNFYKVLVSEQMQNTNKQVVAHIAALKTHYTNLVQQVITEGMESGVFSKDVDVVLIHSTMTGTVLQTMINQDYYANYYKLGKTASAATREELKNKLSAHLKNVFKLILGYEE